MPIRHLSLCVIALCLLASCKKNNGSDSSGNSYKLKMYIEDAKTSYSHVTDTFNVTYDNNNRITSLSSPALKFVYTYSSKSFTLDLYENNSLSIHEILYINSASYVDSTFQFNNTNDTTTEAYTYTGSLLTSMIEYTYSSSGGTSIFRRDDYTYDNNGNTIKDVQTDGQGHINMTSTFTYTNYPVNVRINPTYYPLGAKYLPATQKVTDATGNPIATISYTYAFDGAGRLTKETASADNGDVGVKTYVYY